MFIILASTKVAFLVNVALVLSPLTYNGKSENWPLLLSHCRYFEKNFTEVFLELSSAKHIIFVKISEFDWLPWQQKCKKKIQNHLLRTHKGE